MFRNVSRLFMRIPVLGSIFSACLLLLAFPYQSAFAATTWNIVATPNGQYSDNELDSVAGSASNDLWAVGRSYNKINVGLIEHWDGSAWTVANAPAVVIGGVTASNTSLQGVAAVSSTDVWAVGNARLPSPGHRQALLEHWNGTAWSVVQPPAPPARTDYYLNAVTAISSNDVWAVGYYYGYSASAGGYVNQALALHWDGTSWSAVPTPLNMDVTTASTDAFSGVAALASNNVWAVGSTDNASLIEHWDGTSWTVVNSPVPSSPTHGAYQLHGIATDGSGDLWAVGSYSYLRDVPLVERWDGTNWTIVKSPYPLSTGVSAGNPVESPLSSVTVVSATSAWAVGQYEPSTADGSQGSYQTLIEHWDGTSWSIVDSPNTSASDAVVLLGVASVGGSTTAVGSSNSNTFALAYASA